MDKPATDTMTSVVECRNLNVQFKTDEGLLSAVSDLSFSLNAGECLGVVGESGSGKSQTFLAMLGLLADNGTASGSVTFGDQELLHAPRKTLDSLRGNKLSMIFQDSLSALTPTMCIGDQLSEVLVHHKGMSKTKARAKVIEVLEIFNIPDAAQRYRSYPFEMSGGMRQRVMIALATLCQPEVLIADEPTTALDVTVQAQILRLLDGLKRHTRTSIVLITHDLAIVAGLCDRIMIMYAGRAIELGTVRQIFERPQHPYTRGLVSSVPDMESDPEVDLPTIPGQPPSLENLPAGCAFAPRCAHVMERCISTKPVLQSISHGEHSDAGGYYACHLGDNS